VYAAAEKLVGVSKENWLPITAEMKALTLPWGFMFLISANLLLCGFFLSSLIGVLEPVGLMPD